MKRFTNKGEQTLSHFPEKLFYVPFHEFGKIIPTPSALNVNSQA